jgi:hypothetical protein
MNNLLNNYMCEDVSNIVMEYARPLTIKDKFVKKFINAMRRKISKDYGRNSVKTIKATSTILGGFQVPFLEIKIDIQGATSGDNYFYIDTNKGYILELNEYSPPEVIGNIYDKRLDLDGIYCFGRSMPYID